MTTRPDRHDAQHAPPPRRVGIAGTVLLIVGLLIFAGGLLLYCAARAGTGSDPATALRALARLESIVQAAGYLLMLVGFCCVLAYRWALSAARRQQRRPPGTGRDRRTPWEQQAHASEAPPPSRDDGPRR